MVAHKLSDIGTSSQPTKKIKKFFKKHLTNNKKYGIINTEIKERGKQNGKSKYGNYV